MLMCKYAKVIFLNNSWLIQENMRKYKRVKKKGIKGNTSEGYGLNPKCPLRDIEGETEREGWREID